MSTSLASYQKLELEQDLGDIFGILIKEADGRVRPQTLSIESYKASIEGTLECPDSRLV